VTFEPSVPTRLDLEKEGTVKSVSQIHRIRPNKSQRLRTRREGRVRPRRFATRVECLEVRSLLSTVLKEFPIQSPIGSGNDQLEAIVSGPDRSAWFIDNLGDAEQLGKIAPSGSITWFPNRRRQGRKRVVWRAHSHRKRQRQS
jgi:hypothetical protein